MTFEKFKKLISSGSELPNLVADIPEKNEIFPDSIEKNEHTKAKREIEQSTIFALFLPYTRVELTGKIIAGEQPYPHKFRVVKRYKTYDALLDAYANTPCPASQTIVAVDEKDYEEQLALWNKRYDSKIWLEENLFPYL